MPWSRICWSSVHTLEKRELFLASPGTPPCNRTLKATSSAAVAVRCVSSDDTVWHARLRMLLIGNGFYSRRGECVPSVNSEIGRPSVDPELMIRMLLVGYCYAIRHERRLCQGSGAAPCVPLVLQARSRR